MKSTRKIQCRAALLALLLALLSAGCAAGTAKSGSTAAAAPNPRRLEEMYGIPAVSVLMDLPTDNGGMGGEPMTKTIQYLPGFEKDFMVSVEVLPNYNTHPADRDAVSTRVRTELMAGKGPDLFLCAHPLYGWTAGPDSFPLFNFPEQAMENRVFLPLNDYIANAEYMEWDKLIPQVMEAGQSGENQLLLPLSFFFSATLYPEDYSPGIPLPAAWEEMLKSGDPALAGAVSGLGLQNMMGRLADFSSDSLLFTEEELFQLTQLSWESGLRRQQENASLEAPVVGFDRNGTMGGEGESIALLQEGGFRMIPPYNTEGGITAYVTAFAAVNSNAKYPQLAFKIADYLLSEKVQQSGYLNISRMEGMPVVQGLGSREKPLRLASDARDWFMEDGAFQEYQELLEQINVVRFPGPLDAEIWSIFGATEGERKKSVHEHYMKMQMYLAES